jgi:hypothetical protein
MDPEPGADGKMTFAANAPAFPPPLRGRVRAGDGGNGGARGYPPLQLSPARGRGRTVQAARVKHSRMMTAGGEPLRIRLSNSALFSRDTASRSRRADRASFCLAACPPISEGAGNAGRTMHPQPRMQMKKAYEHSHHGHTGPTRHSPRDGFNSLFRALPGDRAFLPPSSCGHLRTT